MNIIRKKIERVKKITIYIGGMIRSFLAVLLDPLFYLGTVFIALVINSFFSDNSDELPVAIAYLIENRISSIFLIIVWGLFSVLKLNYDREKADNKVKDEKISLLTRQIDISSGMIEARYGEFAEKIFEDNISKIFKETINHFSILESVHLYKYNLQKVNNFIEVKIKFFLGEEQERVCLNVIKQHYYKIDKNIFLKLIKLREEDGEFLKSVSEIIFALFKSDMDEAMKQKLLEILMRYLNKYSGDENKGLIPKDEKYIRSKCAMVVPIVINNAYMYQYFGDNKEKQGRIYFSTQISLDKEYIINLVMDGTDFNYENLENYFNEVIEYIKLQYNTIVNNH